MGFLGFLFVGSDEDGKNAFVREFTILLNAKESYEFTSEFEVKY